MCAVGWEEGWWAGQGSRFALPAAKNHLPLCFFSLFFVYTNTGKRCERFMIGRIVGVVLIKSNLSGEGINLELLGCESKRRRLC